MTIPLNECVAVTGKQARLNYRVAAKIASHLSAKERGVSAISQGCYNSIIRSNRVIEYMANKAGVKGEARQHILNAAEQLFGQHGVDAVSLRNINATAGVSPGVLHYHFGSREVLVMELINRHMSTLVGERQRMLQQLPDTPTVEAIVEALLLPLANFALAGEDGKRYINFIARLYSDRSIELQEASRRYHKINGQVPALLAKALPGQSAAELELRFAMANHTMLHTLADLTNPIRPWLSEAGAEMPDTDKVALLLRFMCAGIRADH